MPLAEFLKNRKGGVAPMLALAAIPLIGSVGAAVDYSRASSGRAAMQAAADATALFLVKTSQSSPNPSAQALTHFNANFHRPDLQISDVSATPSAVANQQKLTVTAEGSMKTMIMGVLGVSAIPLKVKATAASIFDGYGCVLALDKQVSSSFLGQGSTAVNLKGCSLYDNSNNKEALTVGGSAKVSARSVGVVGGITPGSYGLTADQGISTGILAVDDPYKDVEPPSPGPCTENNFHTTTSVTINPGVYCGGMAIHSGATVTLNPGVYYLDGGDLAVNGNAGLIGDGVTLVFTKKNKNSYATATINGSATVSLTAPLFGPTAGIVMFGDRGIPKGTDYKLNGGASQNFGGAVYFPTATINFTGGNGTGAACTQIIGNVVNFSGNSNLAIDCSSQKTKPFGVWTIRLES